MSEELTKEYAEKIKPMLELAKKAYGSRNQSTPAHIASKAYTALLIEYTEKDGSLLRLANELGVAYSGMRRRVFTAKTPSALNSWTNKNLAADEVAAAIERVRLAKQNGGTRAYHRQLSTEYYKNGVSLGAIAKGLGIKNAAPLYYGVNRHTLREV